MVGGGPGGGDTGPPDWLSAVVSSERIDGVEDLAIGVVSVKSDSRGVWLI
jgi:hypothetical protein